MFTFFSVVFESFLASLLCYFQPYSYFPYFLIFTFYLSSVVFESFHASWLSLLESFLASLPSLLSYSHLFTYLRLCLSRSLRHIHGPEAKCLESSKIQAQARVDTWQYARITFQCITTVTFLSGLSLTVLFEALKRVLSRTVVFDACLESYRIQNYSLDFWLWMTNLPNFR